MFCRCIVAVGWSVKLNVSRKIELNDDRRLPFTLISGFAKLSLTLSGIALLMKILAALWGKSNDFGELDRSVLISNL